MPSFYGEELYQVVCNNARPATPRMTEVDHATIALRGAARAWVEASDGPAGRSASSAWRAADREHLRAAIIYTRHVLACAVANGSVASGEWHQMLDALVEQVR